MATAGDGVTTYQSGGVGGKFRKRPIRRSSPGTPYDRPPTALRNNSSSLLAKLVDPASRLIYAGADRLFGVFRKRLPPIPAQRLPGISEEPRNESQEQEAGPYSSLKNGTEVLEHTNEDKNLATVSAATEISELETMLKQKTFTRSEIERLTALLHSRTIESDVGEEDRAKIPSTTFDLFRPEASTSGTLNTHVETRETSHAAISTPVVNSRTFEEDVASPAELAKAYMGRRPAKLSPSTLSLGSQPTKQGSMLFNDTKTLPKTPITSLVPKTTGTFKVSENGLTTPKSRGRSAIYNMARTPYYRGPSTFSQKGVASPSLISSQPVAWEHGGSIESSKMAAKRRSSVLEDIGSGGPMRRTRQKANLLSQGSSLSRQKSEFASSPKLLLRNEPELKVYKAVEENVETSKRNLGYASVPTESSQMALKIFEQLERMSPKEKPSGSKLSVSTEKVDSPNFPQNKKKSEGQHRVWLPDARDSTSQSKDTIQENGPRNFAGPSNVLGLMSGNSTVPVRGGSPVVTNTGSTSKVSPNSSQKKQTFLMSAHEDSLELDDDNRSNGHVSLPLDGNNKPWASGFAKNDVSINATTVAVPEDRKTSLLEVNKFAGISEFKKNAISPPKTGFGSSGGSAFDGQMGLNSTASHPSSSNNQSSVLSQSTFVADLIAPQREQTVFSTFGSSTASAQTVPPFSFSANEPSGAKPSNSLDARPHGSTSLMNSDVGNNQVQHPASNKDDNGNASASGIFSFGASTRNSCVTNGTPASTSISASSTSFQASGTITNKLFGNSSSHVFSSSTAALLSSATTTTSSSASISSSMAAPIFSFGSSTSNSVAPSSVVEAPVSSAVNAKEQKSDDINSSSFANTSLATTINGGGISGFSSPAATSTTNQFSQGSLFNGTNEFQANTQASTGATQAVPFNFGSSSTSHVSGIPPSSSGTSLFNSSAFSFGLRSAVNTSEIKSGSSTSSSTTNLFGSAFNSKPSFGLGSTVASTETKSGSSTSGSTTSIFGSTAAWQPPQSSTFGSTPFSFGASSTMPSATSSPVMFGSSNSVPPTGSSMFSFTSSSATNSSFPAPVFGNPTPVFGASPANNDQMSMEDSMADDTIQTPSASVPAFAQASGGTTQGFMFGSGTKTPSTVPFQFGGQTSQPPSQNPFQASGSVDFNAGGSFSLGSGGGDKSGRRILKVKRQIKRK